MNKKIKAAEKATVQVAENVVSAVKHAHPVDAAKNFVPTKKLGRLTRVLPNTVSRKASRALLVGSKHSPTILFAGGVVSAVATTVMACRATLKLEGVLEDLNRDLETAKEVRGLKPEAYSEQDHKRDAAFLYTRTVVKVGKLYAPSFGLGVLSIAALAGSHNILSKRNAAVTAAYAALDKGFKEYRERVISEFGEDKERELRYATEKRTIVEEGPNGPEKKELSRADTRHTPSPYARFFDQLTRDWSPTPEYNLLRIQCVQNYANDMLQARGHLFLNEVYDMLGIERSKAGQSVGWALGAGGDDFIDFGVFDGDNPRARDFVNGREGSILLDFNVDGVVLDQIK